MCESLYMCYEARWGFSRKVLRQEKETMILAYKALLCSVHLYLFAIVPSLHPWVVMYGEIS